MSASSVVLKASARTTLSSRSVWFAALWLVLGVAIAVMRRGEGADDVVLGAVGALAVPLLSFALAGAAVANRSFQGATLPLVRFGAPPLPSMLSPFAVAAISSALASALLGAATVLLTRSAGAPAGDVLTTTWVSALGGACYTALFVAASSFGKSGGGRAVALALDVVFGAGSGLGSALSMRGHLRNLLGGSSPLDIGQRASFVWMLALAIFAVALAVWRTSPRQASLRRARAH